MSASILSIKQKYEPYLLGIKGVQGIAVNGSILVIVEKLTPEILQIIPKQLEGVPVRIKESGRLRTMSFRPMEATYAERTGRWRPAPGGISCGHPKSTAGTITCCLLNKRTGLFDGGLANNHVAGLQWGNEQEGRVGDSILQPGPYDGGVDPDDDLGVVTDIVPVAIDQMNKVDITKFESEQLRRDILDIGKPTYTIEPQLGMRVVKSGRSSGVTYGTITGINATVMIDGGEGWGSCLFEDQIIIEPAVLIPGDSGSWIGEIDTYNTVGVGAAGSDIMSIANKALNIEAILGDVIVPISSPLSVAKVMSVVAGLGVGGIIVLEAA